MAARRQLTPDPLDEIPFWKTRGFAFGIAMLALLGTAALTVWLIGLNHRQQREWRLELDPGLAAIKADLIQKIAAARPGTPQAPLALWLGRIRDATMTQSTDGSPPVTVLKLENASLLTGNRGKKDTGETLIITGKQYSFTGPAPRSGEVWMVSIWRDKEENNVIHRAVRTGLK